jgi:CRISPR-associated protein Cas2
MRIMRLLVLFDLPTGNSSERKSYTRFRKFLIEDGYTMEQYSVYSRVLLSRASTEAHLSRLRKNLPEAGQVTALVLTEKQFEDREVLVNTTVHKDTPQDIGAQLTLVI